jgi:hypothetical protein
MGYSARKKDVSARSQDRHLSIADKGELSIQHIERFVFRMVKVVRRLKAWGRGEMNQRIRPSCWFAFGQEDMQVVEEPIGWCIIEGCGLQKLRRHRLNLRYQESAIAVQRVRDTENKRLTCLAEAITQLDRPLRSDLECRPG